MAWFRGPALALLPLLARANFLKTHQYQLENGEIHLETLALPGLFASVDQIVIARHNKRRKGRKGPKGEFVVTGAGDDQVNGKYKSEDGPYGTYGGHPAYRHVDVSGKIDMKSGEIYKLGDDWVMSHADVQGSLYFGRGETPDTAAWKLGPAGKAPIPTVALKPEGSEHEEPQPEAEPEPEPEAEPEAEHGRHRDELLAALGLLVLVCLIVLCAALAFRVGTKEEDGPPDTAAETSPKVDGPPVAAVETSPKVDGPPDAAAETSPKVDTPPDAAAETSPMVDRQPDAAAQS